jgi:hypothetical protein
MRNEIQQLNSKWEKLAEEQKKKLVSKEEAYELRAWATLGFRVTLHAPHLECEGKGTAQRRLT